MSFDLAAFRAQQTPQRRALFWQGCWLDYATLNQRAERLAGRLRALGVMRGDRVSVLALNHLAHVDLLLAAPKLGVIYAPLNYRLALPEQQRLVAQAAPALIFHDALHAGVASALGRPTVALDDYEGWLAGPVQWALPPPLGPEDPWMLLWTGGSTGAPKGALLSYRQLWTNARATVSTWGVGADDVAIQAPPAFHAAVNVLATPLWFAGGAVVWLSQFDPGLWWRVAAEQRVTLPFMVPSMFQALAADPAFAQADLAAWRWAVTGGAPCPVPLREIFLRKGVGFRVGFGMTEVGVNCFTADLALATHKPHAVGAPMPGLQARIIRPDGSLCEPGEVGELCFSGEQVFAGYFDQPEATVASWRDGFFVTGDLASCDEEGHYRICGRRKEMYISGGENVFPVEVEAALHGLPGIIEAAVHGCPDLRWGESGVAWVVQAASADWTAERLRAALRERLAGYKLPAAVYFLSELPKTGAGKIDKTALRQRWEASTPSEVAA